MAGSSSSGGSPFVPGTLIAGKYRLIKLLGEGAMGVVWSAVNEMTSGEVALKLILKPEPEYRTRLLREARSSCAVRHKNVIQIHDVGQTDSGDPFLVMELLSGETLQELLARKRRLSPAEAAGIGRDVARGLAAAHANKIIHRDLKPANIYLHNAPGEDFPVVKVLDFGVAKNLSLNDGLHTAVGGAVGSPMYMSPEQARRAPDIDVRSDIWSLGVVLFEMLTGDRPFRGDLGEVLHQILKGDIPTVGRRIRKIDPELDAIVAGCLERDRDKRLGPAADVARMLDEHGTPAGRDPLPSLMEEALSDRIPAGPGASSSSGALLSPATGLAALQPSGLPGYGRAPEPRPSSSGSGAAQASPGFGVGQSQGYGAAQSPGYGAAQSPGYGAGQSPGMGAAGRGGIALTPAGPPVQAGLHQSGSYGVTAPLTSSPTFSGPRPAGVPAADDDAATHRMDPRMLAPAARHSSAEGDIGPSGTVRIDPNVVEQAILARGAVPASPGALPAPPAPGVPSARTQATTTAPYQPNHPTLPLVPGGVISSTAPMLQERAVPAFVGPGSASQDAVPGGRKKVAIAIGVAVVAAALAVLLLLFGFPGKTVATPTPVGSSGMVPAPAQSTLPAPSAAASASSMVSDPSGAPAGASAAPTTSGAPVMSAVPSGAPVTKPTTPQPPLTGKLPVGPSPKGTAGTKKVDPCSTPFKVGCKKIFEPKTPF